MQGVERSPSVDGSIMSSGSVDDSTNCVSALGGGAMSLSRAGCEYWSCELLEDEPLNSSSDGFLRCRNSGAAGVGRLRLTALSSADGESSSSNLSTPFDMSSRWSIHVVCIPLLTLMRVDKFRARTSRVRSGSFSTGERSVDKLVCVEIELCNSALDNSSACTLRSSSVSRKGSTGGGGGAMARLRLRMYEGDRRFEEATRCCGK